MLGGWRGCVLLELISRLTPLWARLMLCQLEVVKLTPQTDPATICLSPDQGPVQEHNQGEVREMF